MYIVAIEKYMEFYLCLWSSIFVYGVLSLSMEFYLCLWLGWVQSMRKLGAKYLDTFGCMSMPFGCMSMDRLSACMRLLGAKYAETFGYMYMPFGCISDTADSLPDSR